MPDPRVPEDSVRRAGASTSTWWNAGTRVGVRLPQERPRWERCIEHRDDSARLFIATHFKDTRRRVLIVGGAGFDPRATMVTSLVADAAGDNVCGIFLRERRVLHSDGQRQAAERTVDELTSRLSSVQIVDVEAIDADDAVVLGRNVITALRTTSVDELTDVVIDFSALSIGSSFPAARLFLDLVERRGLRDGSQRVNLHAMVCENPEVDHLITPIPSPQVDSVHTFKGGLELDTTQTASRLWIPQLRTTHRGILRQVFYNLSPDEVVPVLPFPSQDPRLGDALLSDFRDELLGPWRVDPRGIIYASESHPLDFYRTVLGIHDRREPVYHEAGGSAIILTPVGSKALAIGALMAALERDLPVRYVEARGYAVGEVTSAALRSRQRLVHIWLAGEAYPPYVVRT